MPQRRHVARAALTAAAATACLAFAAPALAGVAVQTGNPGHNPNGDNGTVKIDGLEFNDTDVRNEPHVTCEFQLQFFNFDQDQMADISLWAQPPSAKVEKKRVWHVEDYKISDDAASGAQSDEDAIITITYDDLKGLDELYEHDKQGYHIKLDVDLTDGKAFDDKHKVFWLQPCAPAESPSTGGGDNGGGGGDSSGTPSTGTSAGGGNGGGSGGGTLPLTGVAATGTALTGLALIGGGVALMVLRRRRDKITFTS